MPLYVKNSVHLVEFDVYWDYDKKYDHRKYYTDYYKLNALLQTKIEQLNAQNSIIKAVVPITTGFSKTHYDHSQSYGYGYGYGLSIITGYTIFATEEYHVSEEEYARLTRKDFLKQKQKELEKSLPDAISLYEQSSKIKTEAVTMEKGFLGGAKFLFNKEEFKTQAEAKARKDELLQLNKLNEDEVNKIRTQLQEIKDELANMP